MMEQLFVHRESWPTRLISYMPLSSFEDTHNVLAEITVRE